MVLDYKNFAVTYEPAINDMVAAIDKSGVFDGERIRLQADCHVGKGCAVGTCLTYTDKIVPALVGCDIACRVSATVLADEIDVVALDKAIRAHVPSGASIREAEHRFSEGFPYDELLCWGVIRKREDRFRKSMGTLGSGNHFISIERGERAGKDYLVIHCGTRNLGKVVFDHYKKRAVHTRERRFRTLKHIRDASIRGASEEGRYEDVPAVNDEYAKSVERLPKDLAYLEGMDMLEYLHDMKLLCEWSRLNHLVIADEISSALGVGTGSSITSIHNYVDTEDRIIRKGAISAKLGQKGIIPLNMRDGSLIVVGKGNEDYLLSAPHGAGRVMSRAQAKRGLDLKRYQEEMEGIYTTSVKGSTIDEAPDAYKAMGDILPAITPTVDVLERIVPIYNFKAN